MNFVLFDFFNVPSTKLGQSSHRKEKKGIANMLCAFLEICCYNQDLKNFCTLLLKRQKIKYQNFCIGY